VRPEFARPTVAEIDLSAFAANVEAVRGLAGGASILAVVKADAYGHGAAPVSRALEAAGVEGFAVALVEEGIELREAGIGRPILVLGGLPVGSERDALAAELTPVVFDAGQVEALARAADGARVEAHVKIDTGMSRLGVSPADLPAFLTSARRHANVILAGALTHLACPDDAAACREQVEIFDDALRRGRFLGFSPSVVHIASSAAIVTAPFSRRSAVRPGILLYGVLPSAAPRAAGLRPAMSLKTKVLQVRDLAAGGRVGYGGTWTAARPSRIATLPVGYADGVSRMLSNRGEVLVRGRRAPIAGSVCMDLTMIDVTDTGAASGDEVVLLGAQGADRITAEEIAERSSTIAYEVLTSVSRRVPRTYRR